MSEWISVEDRLPDLETPVLVTTIGAIYTAMVTHVDEGWYWAVQDSHSPMLNDPDSYVVDDEYQFTYWQPLPEPLKGKDDE